MNRLKSLFIALTVVFCVQLSAQSSLQPAGVDLDYVTWVDGDVLVRFEDHITINFDKLYHIIMITTDGKQVIKPVVVSK